MRGPAILFGAVLATAALFLALGIQGSDAGGQLAPHPEFSSMLVGADGTARQAPVLGWGVAIMLVQVGFLAVAFGLGFGRGRLAPAGLVFAAIVHGASLIALFRSASAYVAAEAPGLLGPFPVPTSILFFVVGPAPLVYLWLFLRHFDAWMPDEAAAARLRDLQRERPEGSAR